MIQNNILLLSGAWMALIAVQSACQTAATQLVNIPVTGGMISTSGSSYLGFDVTGEITISTSNVILDLNGHLVTGSISIAQGLSDVVITNGFVTNNSNTSVISVDNCNDIQLSNITVRNSGGPGITITSSTNIVVKKVICCGPNSNSSCGIELNACSNAMISTCLCRNWNTGIAVIGSSQDIFVEECHVSGTTHGLHFTESTNTTVLNCTSFSNDKGFLFEGDSLVEVSNCVAEANQNQGFDTPAACDIYLAECLAFRNTEEGFKLRDSNNNQNFASKCVAISNGTGFFDPNSARSSMYTSNYANANSVQYDTSNAFKARFANQGGNEIANFWSNALRTNSSRDCSSL